MRAELDTSTGTVVLVPDDVREAAEALAFVSARGGPNPFLRLAKVEVAGLAAVPYEQDIIFADGNTERELERNLRTVTSHKKAAHICWCIRQVVYGEIAKLPRSRVAKLEVPITRRRPRISAIVRSQG